MSKPIDLFNGLTKHATVMISRGALCLVCLMLVNISLTAQKGKGSGGAGPSSAPAGSSGPASASGTQQTGYVYRLPWCYHIRYASVHYSSITFNIPIFPYYISIPILNNQVPVSSNLVKNKNYFSKRVIHKHQAQGISPTSDIHQSHDKVIPGVREDLDSTFPEPRPMPTAIQTVTSVAIDSVSRYWDRESLGIKRWYLPWNWLRYLYKLPDWFARYRLRVSVTQADSGKLQLGIYDRSFGSSEHPFDGKFIDETNLIRGKTRTPDYAIPIGSKDSAQNFYLQIDNKTFTSDPISYIQLRYASTQFGAMLIPYKYRFAPKHTQIYIPKPQSNINKNDTIFPAPSESTGNINIAVFIGRKWGYTRFYFDQTKTHNTLAFMVSGFAGASLIPISLSNVKFPKDADSLASQAIAFSIGGAASLEWRGIDLGIFSGLDITSNKFDWIYNKKIWIGFGIGVNLGMFTSGPTQFQQ